MFPKIGNQILRFEDLGSTNKYLHEMSQEIDLEEGVIILAKNQTSGRGVSGSWDVERGVNLTFSVFLRPIFLEIKDQYQLNYMIAVSLYELIEKHVASVSIKWPNDILIAGKKVAGILIENTLLGKRLGQSIVGIGINVNQMTFSSFNRPATSLRIESGKEEDLEHVLEEFIHILNKNYRQLQLKGGSQFREKYLDYLYLKNELVPFEINQVEVLAKVCGVDTFGRLVIERNGKQEAFQMKEIKFLK